MSTETPRSWIGLDSVVGRYGLALLVVLAAAALRWALQPVMGVAPPYITFYLAIVAAAAIGGLGPGLFATCVGALLGIGVATLPLDKLQLTTAAEQVRLAIYLLSGLAISLIAGALHKARRRAADEAEQLRELTEQLRVANERLLEADRSKDDFLAVLSHELRNPLMPIKHSLYILEQAAADTPAALKARATIARQVDQMIRLVNDLLDVTRITRDKLELQRDRLDLRNVLTATMEDHRAAFTARSIRLEQEQPADPVWVHGDPARISQVLGNLLHNASKFAPQGGTVHVSLQSRGSRAVLRVRDDGVGIPPEMIERIFDPFMQAEQKLGKGAAGLGLGLALVRKLVQLHGGSVAARSDGPGKGAELTVELPVDETQAPAVATPLSTQPAVKRHRVLVIEDNADSADTLSTLLKARGHEVDVSYSGDRGLVKARAFCPDTILCDIGLPGMDGYEVARAVRQDVTLQGARLIALTGYASAEDRERAFAAGFERHLVKPPSIQELEQALGD